MPNLKTCSKFSVLDDVYQMVLEVELLELGRGMRYSSPWVYIDAEQQTSSVRGLVLASSNINSPSP